MKKIYFLFTLLTLMINSGIAQTNCVLQLTNIKTGKKINICTKIDPDKVEAILGKAITLDKEIQEKNEPPVFSFTYDGLTMIMQDNQFKNVTITNKKWKLNNITIGTLFEEVEAKYEQIKKIYFADYKFKIKDSNGFLFIDVDNLKNVKRLGVEF
ncbi:hypothetical protein [Flavobacterium oreochromis]|uniref:Beta-lactamase-inhibitor-like PepSY-like domain-containing protein n=2 Tax=Flavobacterium TaxID=237 RepID=A0A246GCQ4_9FLAO|nr:hypothetical protein [Flavobacterium oreochromis]OWP78781.1 hypothetical protein BWG23_01465 [Flavobacterium oreochromis]OWP78890.1 hypothetical protein BWK62_03755 [Flavobacterium oreochromis]